MIWLFLTLGTVLVAAIALVAVGSAVRRLEESAMPVVLEVDDAVDWIAERLPAEAASQLSRDDVINIVGWYLEVFDAAGLVTDHGQELGDGAWTTTRRMWWPRWTTPWSTWWHGPEGETTPWMPSRLPWQPSCWAPT